MNPFETTLWDTIDEIREADRRYRREAYAFVVAALGVTVQSLPSERLEDPERRHLSGQELLRGVIALARTEFGPLAATVFREWGIHAGVDIGEIVFQLVRSGQLSARPQDSIEDFRGDPDLLQALDPCSDLRAHPRRTRRPGADRPPAAAT
jgi:uncharacterized repeat protein (TIGR04138 family)